MLCSQILDKQERTEMNRYLLLSLRSLPLRSGVTLAFLQHMRKLNFRSTFQTNIYGVILVMKHFLITLELISS